MLIRQPDVIIACNDYLSKLYDYKTENPAVINMDHYKALISCTLRVKAWVYLTLGKIYGEAVWFDDPIREMKDLSNYPVKYPLLMARIRCHGKNGLILIRKQLKVHIVIGII